MSRCFAHSRDPCETCEAVAAVKASVRIRLRDEFAKAWMRRQADEMPGFLHAPTRVCSSEELEDAMADEAYRMADAMIRRRGQALPPNGIAKLEALATKWERLADNGGVGDMELRQCAADLREQLK